MRAGKGPVTPDGDARRGALPPGRRGAAELDAASASSGRCSPTRARWSSPRPTRRSAASTTTASATTRRGRSRSLADYCMGCYTNLNLPSRVDDDREVRAGLRGRRLPRSTRSRAASRSARASCMILREVEKRTGKPGRLHRERPRRPALLLGRERQEPPRVVPPDDRAEAGAGRRPREVRRRHRPRLHHDQGGRPRRGRRAARPRHHQQPQQLRRRLPGRARPRRSSTRASRSSRDELERAGRRARPRARARSATSSACFRARAVPRRRLARAARG